MQPCPYDVYNQVNQVGTHWAQHLGEHLHHLAHMHQHTPHVHHHIPHVHTLAHDRPCMPITAFFCRHHEHCSSHLILSFLLLAFFLIVVYRLYNAIVNSEKTVRIVNITPVNDEHKAETSKDQSKSTSDSSTSTEQTL
ncbi:membrane associated histidine-rich protein [Plasmodium reichenowi]|uniref:Membrane associated histidine-rich protein n=1 Tax=Plasmodium reichenowi TaxID=5854 RepID=A0A060RXW0_PLARE|nr:membrane associated histidine-rich protein [Plasmodium reichenowi]KYN94955.1 membrane associated histidine-rich protein [Plasmodium reichenowi]CDO66315.1 membrane associated histidine-rich protein [Plasmodium reichenowi]SOV82159.1 membrane associated histidine-rich protein [Plasmodium reichenowi]